MGRDIGLFGKDAILDDMTCSGWARPGQSAPSNTSLGRIGLGYIYTDWEPQITYTTATYMGFSGSIGIFQPLDAAGIHLAHDAPQFKRDFAYAWGDPKAANTLTGKVWFDAVSQN
jgi:hypothetical protein